MRVIARIWLAGALACAILALSASAAFGAFAVAKWEAGTCTEEDCTVSTPEKFYTQAAGHPPFGITDFTLVPPSTPTLSDAVKNVRVDLPPGLSVNPEAVQKCSQAGFKSVEVNVPPLPPFFGPSVCPEGSIVGEDRFVVGTEAGPVELTGTVYNLEQPEGLPLEFGIAIDIAPLTHGLLPPATGFSHVYLEGGVSWRHEEIQGGVASGDYHEFFVIKDIPQAPPTIKSRLITHGNLGDTSPLNGALVTMPSSCEGPQTTSFFAESYSGETATEKFTTPVGVEGCDKVPFAPSINVTPSTTQSDQPDAATVKVELPQNPEPSGLYSSDLKDARVTLPEGMTLNPASVVGLEACTDAQFGKGTASPVGCPAGSQIGTATIETPNLPAGSLVGKVYAGVPLSTNPESGLEYRIFIDAESARYNVAVRLEGRVVANATTGRLTTLVLDNPQLPFTDFIIALGGPHVPLANPLVCGAATTAGNFVPYTGHPSAVEAFMSFPVDFNGKGGACPAILPFSLAQSTQTQPATGGTTTSFTLNLVRSDGNQYLSKVSTTLPEGLVAKIPSVTLCGEPQAAQGTCTSASQIGTATVSLGAGPGPLLTLSGSVYLTGPYGGAPYGLSVVVPAEKVGPYNYGTIITRATIGIDVFSARVTVSSTLPTIVGGAPLRLRTLTVNVNHPNFMLNPTNCGVLSTDTTLFSTFGSLQLISTPFQVSGCSALSFKPLFRAKTNAKASRRHGAMLEVTVGYPVGPQANIRSVSVQLPKQLPSRLSTLNKACPEATFLTNPHNCPEGSRVGGVIATTPTLPEKLTGRAFFVSHGGAAFPDLDLDMQGNGVKIILVGNTNITKGITTSTFPSLPDVPVSSFALKLPYGRYSALAAHGNLCTARLFMPTTITAQNGAVIKQRTRISVSGCGVQIVSHRVRGHRAVVGVQVPGAGRLTAGGGDLATVHRRVRKAGRLTLSVPLSSAGLRALARHHPLTVKLRVRFTPAKGRSSVAAVKLRFG